MCVYVEACMQSCVCVCDMHDNKLDTVQKQHAYITQMCKQRRSETGRPITDSWD
jgi:hypothetical protein